MCIKLYNHLPLDIGENTYGDSFSKESKVGRFIRLFEYRDPRFFVSNIKYLSLIK